MQTICCDLHTCYQQVAMLDADAGEIKDWRLEHESGEVRAFYGALAGPGASGIEAAGSTYN
jgi:hypothetical protein